MRTQVQVSMAGWLLCMTLVLAALAGVLGQPRYNNFLRQHVDYPRTSIAGRHYCDTMMRRRGINVQGGPCKYQNTFVHAGSHNLVAACSQAPYPNTNLHSTSRRLSITHCRLRGGSTQPPCSYTTTQLQHYVVVGCVNGRPVHLQTTYP